MGSGLGLRLVHPVLQSWIMPASTRGAPVRPVLLVRVRVGARVRMRVRIRVKITARVRDRIKVSVRPVHQASKASASLSPRSEPHEGGGAISAGEISPGAISPGTISAGEISGGAISGGEISGVQSHPCAEGGEATWPAAMPSSGRACTTGSPAWA